MHIFEIKICEHWKNRFFSTFIIFQFKNATSFEWVFLLKVARRIWIFFSWIVENKKKYRFLYRTNCICFDQFKKKKFLLKKGVFFKVHQFLSRKLCREGLLRMKFFVLNWVVPRQGRVRNPTPSDLAQILHTCLLDQHGRFWKFLNP